MDAKSWSDSWDKGGFYTSFHRRDIHPYVTKYLSPEAIAGKTVLVPLCGKSVDMLYLAESARLVIGVELIEYEPGFILTKHTNGLINCRIDEEAALELA